MGTDRDATTGGEAVPDVAADERVEDRAGSAASAVVAGLSDEARAFVKQTVAGMDPLTDDERDYLAYMFHRRI